MKTAIFLGLVCVVSTVILGPFEMLRSVILGWLSFLLHTLPRTTVDWPSVFIGAVALVLFLAGVDSVGRAWRRKTADGPRWKFRWSLATVAVLFLLFAAGISLVGIVHQIGWLFASPEPYYVRTVRLRWQENSPSKLKTIGIALKNHDGTYGYLPGSSTAFTPEGRMLHSWETRLLPFFPYATFGEKDGEDASIDITLPWNHPRNERAFKSIIPEFINNDLTSPPALDAKGFGLSHYAANVHVLGPNTALRLADIRDGAANTLLVGEVNAHFKPWGHPVNWRDPAKGINRSPRGFGGAPYSGGANFCMSDGSVRFVSERIDADVLRALGTPNGGEEIAASILGPSR